MPDSLEGYDQAHLEMLRLAVDVLLRASADIPDTMEVELVLFQERLEQALLG